MLERRKFLATLTAGLATAATPGALFAACHDLVQAGPSGPQQDLFRQLLGSNFKLKDAEGSVSSARLVAFDDGPQFAQLEQFSIVFEGSDLAEGLYEVRHQQMGKLLISLMPSGQSGSGMNRQRAYFSSFV